MQASKPHRVRNFPDLVAAARTGAALARVIIDGEVVGVGGRPYGLRARPSAPFAASGGAARPRGTPPPPRRQRATNQNRRRIRTASYGQRARRWRSSRPLSPPLRAVPMSDSIRSSPPPGASRSAESVVEDLGVRLRPAYRPVRHWRKVLGPETGRFVVRRRRRPPPPARASRWLLPGDATRR